MSLGLAKNGARWVHYSCCGRIPETLEPGYSYGGTPKPKAADCSYVERLRLKVMDYSCGERPRSKVMDYSCETMPPAAHCIAGAMASEQNTALDLARVRKTDSQQER